MRIHRRALIFSTALAMFGTEACANSLRPIPLDAQFSEAPMVIAGTVSRTMQCPGRYSERKCAEVSQISYLKGAPTANTGHSIIVVLDTRVAEERTRFRRAGGRYLLFLREDQGAHFLFHGPASVFKIAAHNNR